MVKKIKIYIYILKGVGGGDCIYCKCMCVCMRWREVGRVAGCSESMCDSYFKCVRKYVRCSIEYF